MLCIGDGLGTIPMMRQTGTFKNCVWRWQERFAEEQMDWLLLNKTAPLRPLNQRYGFTVGLATVRCPAESDGPRSHPTTHRSVYD